MVDKLGIKIGLYVFHSSPFLSLPALCNMYSHKQKHQKPQTLLLHRLIQHCHETVMNKIVAFSQKSKSENSLTRYYCWAQQTMQSI